MIIWTAPPPSYFAGPRDEIVYPLKRAELSPPIGRVWMRPNYALTRTARQWSKAVLRGAV